MRNPGVKFINSNVTPKKVLMSMLEIVEQFKPSKVCVLIFLLGLCAHACVCVYACVNVISFLICAYIHIFGAKYYGVLGVLMTIVCDVT